MASGESDRESALSHVTQHEDPMQINACASASLGPSLGIHTKVQITLARASCLLTGPQSSPPRESCLTSNHPKLFTVSFVTNQHSTCTTRKKLYSLFLLAVGTGGSPLPTLVRVMTVSSSPLTQTRSARVKESQSTPCTQTLHHLIQTSTNTRCKPS